MPDARTLQEMYGTSYAGATITELDIDDPRADEWVFAHLTTVVQPLFVDYGCGEGRLLKRVRERGHDVLGVELADDVVREVATETGLPVVRREEALGPWAGRADVVHLGDVIEHLPDPERELGDILALLRPGGLLLAQGPLEANPSLFHSALKAVGILRHDRPTTFPPYHVHLATGEGQLALFARCGLDTVDWRVSEVSWPAPSRLHRSDLRDPRTVGLFSLRAVSKIVSGARRSWGNRYVYAGRRAA